MLASRFRQPAKNSHFCSVLKTPSSFLILSQTLKMAHFCANSKRSTCPTCARPAWLCLCARIKTKELDNSVSVTILQHSLEKKHPLNSTRIAKVGLKNVNVATVSDVNFDAQFVIRLMERESEMGSFCFSRGKEFDQVFDDCNETSTNFAHEVFAKCPKVKSFDQKQFVKSLDFMRKSGSGTIEEGNDAEDEFGLETSRKRLVEQSDEEKIADSDCDVIRDGQRGDEGAVIIATVGKQGVVSYLSHIWMPQIRHKKSNFDKILETRPARDALAKGFVVVKLGKRQRVGGLELDEYVEFEVEVPPGSVLLFPSEDAVGTEGLKASNFDVKNLIVLDGTWAKAKRMYAENPWLKLLPHLKLVPDKASLYGGVRMQPKAGCLSTIESIVYALKEVGDANNEGLDDLLDVFESMIGDQRRYKERRMSNAS